MAKNTKESIVFNSKIITLRSVYDKAGIKYMIQPCKNKLGQYPSCVRRVDANGDMIMSEADKNRFAEGKLALFPADHFFTIVSGLTFNLDDIWDKATWEAIENCPLIAKDRNAKDSKGNFIIDGPKTVGSKAGRNGVAELYIDRPGLDNVIKLTRKKKIHQAEAYIYNEPNGEEGLRVKAKVLGRDMSNQPISDVTAYLLEVCEKHPDRIIDLYTGSDLELRILLIDAKNKGIISRKDNLYIYLESVILGATEDAVLNWMLDSKNAKTLALIKKDTYPEYYKD